MKRHSISSWGLALTICLALSSCNLPTPTDLPTCTEGQLQAPIDLDPDGEWIVLDPAVALVLQWGYPETTCTPDFFEVYVWTGLEPATPGMTGRVNYDDAYSPGVWMLIWPVLLEPGNTYYWRVYPGLETGPGPDVDGPNTRAHFFTGPVCTDDGAMQPVDLISPEDDITVAPDDEITFAWDDPTSCLVDGLFEIDFHRSPTSPRVYGIPILQTVYTTTPAEIGLEECTRYYWRIKTDPSGPPEEPFSDFRTFFVQPPGVICPLVDLRIPPAAIARLNLNCRSGPGPAYHIDDTFFAGASAPIVGRNPESTWWYILSPNLNIHCWVWGEQVDIEGEVGEVQVVEVGPPPTDEPTNEPPPQINCAQYTDSQSCGANPACLWESYLTTQGGQCVNR
ncbi:MAG: hypothetical protein JXB85_17715 [Anaerolineales bacterium]|nr:hypothetical protein [Anaerolineales bacterium]